MLPASADITEFYFRGGSVECNIKKVENLLMPFSTIFEPFESIVVSEESSFECFFLSYLEIR
jgi:hypothetical protein